MTNFDRVKGYYRVFDEKNRLVNSGSGKLEYMMSMDLLKHWLPENGKMDGLRKWGLPFRTLSGLRIPRTAARHASVKCSLNICSDSRIALLHTALQFSGSNFPQESCGSGFENSIGTRQKNSWKR